MKNLQILPDAKDIRCQTNSAVGEGLLSTGLNLQMVCGGNGMCATCHVIVVDGHENLSPMNAREERTLGLLTGRLPNSRLSCQARMLGDVKVRLPDSEYVSQVEELSSRIGQRAGRDIVHAIDGRILVQKGQVITKYVLNQLRKATSGQP